MTGTDTSLPARIAALEQRWGSLQEGLTLKDVFDALEDLHTQLTQLPIRLQDVRTRGYMFKAYLERKIQVLQDQWAPMRATVQSQAQQQASTLRIQSMQTDGLFAQLRVAVGTPAVAAGMATSVDSALTDLEHKVAAAKSTLLGMFDELKTNVEQTKRQLDEIEFTLAESAQATFPWLAGEDVVLAVQAQLDKEGKDDPKGVLFLTDSRLLFEQKEKVAKRKVLFIATESETVQQLLLEVTLPDVEAVKATSKGLMGKDDWLEFKFQGGAPVRAANFHIWYESKDWQALYGRVKSGDIAQERVKPKDAALAAAVKAAPTKCPTCGATLNLQIVKGITQVNCDYCGSVIRL